MYKILRFLLALKFRERREANEEQAITIDHLGLTRFNLLILTIIGKLWCNVPAWISAHAYGWSTLTHFHFMLMPVVTIIFYACVFGRETGSIHTLGIYYAYVFGITIWIWNGSILVKISFSQPCWSSAAAAHNGPILSNLSRMKTLQYTNVIIHLYICLLNNKVWKFILFWNCTESMRSWLFSLSDSLNTGYLPCNHTVATRRKCF